MQAASDYGACGRLRPTVPVAGFASDSPDGFLSDCIAHRSCTSHYTLTCPLAYTHSVWCNWQHSVADCLLGVVENETAEVVQGVCLSMRPFLTFAWAGTCYMCRRSVSFCHWAEFMRNTFSFVKNFSFFSPSCLLLPPCNKLVISLEAIASKLDSHRFLIPGIPGE